MNGDALEPFAELDNNNGPCTHALVTVLGGALVSMAGDVVAPYPAVALVRPLTAPISPIPVFALQQMPFSRPLLDPTAIATRGKASYVASGGSVFVIRTGSGAGTSEWKSVAARE